MSGVAPSAWAPEAAVSQHLAAGRLVSVLDDWSQTRAINFLDNDRPSRQGVQQRAGGTGSAEIKELNELLQRNHERLGATKAQARVYARSYADSI